MNKIYNPCIFQGQKQLKSNKEYFEGWYFKNTNQKETISFIPGIAINSERKEAFIQVITQESSWYIPYNIMDFSYTTSPFSIKIGDNYFSESKIKINIDNNLIKINGLLEYSEIVEIQHSLISPNIMGIFSFIPNMECNHAIISMKHKINGMLNINDKIMEFNDGIGYIEKDWGSSFPSKYTWGQANCFSNESVSLFFAIATIPFKGFHFQGLICNFILDNEEYRFATYNGSKIVKNEQDKGSLNLILKKNEYTIEIIAKSNDTQTLKSPQKGQMKNHIQESIQAEIEVVLRKNNNILYKGISLCAGLEIT